MCLIMKLKDVIFIAIFSVLFFAVMLVAVAVLGSTPVTFFFTHGVSAVPCGIIYMYVRAKVQRKGSVLLMCTLVALIAFWYYMAISSRIVHRWYFC